MTSNGSPRATVSSSRADQFADDGKDSLLGVFFSVTPNDLKYWLDFWNSAR